VDLIKVSGSLLAVESVDAGAVKINSLLWEGLEEEEN
jgi:hypothetical protein